MVIPNSVRVNGRQVPVYVDETGTVTVGSTTVTMNPEVSERIESMPYDQHFIPWQEQMFNIFERAYKQEKKKY